MSPFPNIFSEDSSDLTPAQLELNRRYELALTYLLDNPTHNDHLLRDHLLQTFQISRSQAYRDIAEIKKRIGNIKNAGKEWYRHVAITMSLETYREAKEANNLKSMNAAISNLIKAAKLDKEDQEDFDWERIIPPTFEPSPDISILNLPDKATQDVAQRRAALRKKFLTTDIIDIQPLATPSP